MRILVCISKTPDTTSKISFKNDNIELDETGLAFIINPYDEWYSLVKAIELKEADSTREIDLISVGLNDVEPILKKCFALGGDRAYRINYQPKTSADTAFQLASFIKNNHYDLIFCGKETIDYNGGAVGAMLAEHLNIPHISMVSALEIIDQNAVVTTELDNGTEKYSCPLPLVICSQKGLAEQRIPNMRNIIASRNKTILTIEPVEYETNLQNVKFDSPPPKSGVKIIDKENIDELVQILHNDLKLF